MKPQTTSEAIENFRTELRKLGAVCIAEFKKDIQSIKNFLWPKPVPEPLKRLVRPPNAKECPTCHGTRTIEIHETRLGADTETKSIYEEHCEDCDGLGYVMEHLKSVYEI